MHKPSKHDTILKHRCRGPAKAHGKPGAEGGGGIRAGPVELASAALVQTARNWVASSLCEQSERDYTVRKYKVPLQILPFLSVPQL